MRETYYDKECECYFANHEMCAFDKLGQLEDIEDELGIDLIILFKALKNGVYFQGDKELKNVNLRMFFEEPMLVYKIEWNIEEEVYVKAYNKTWALTKEELK